MSHDDFAPIAPAHLQWQQDTPVAIDFDDPYFSRQDGAAESRYVFLAGNDLPRRFAALSDNQRFVIGETGFGTGLNLLLAARLFQRHAPSGARLDLISVEKHPLRRGDLARALSHWPDLAALAAALLAQYPPACAGFHRLRLTETITLTLLFGEAETCWRLSDARVDAWFLDGFAPARNPGMWRAALFDELAGHSRPGATLATFTAAGVVRRGLQEAGFDITRQDGFGHKRHMLTGRMPGTWVPTQTRTGLALIAGAGLAGATTARALAERGWRVTVLDPAGIAGGASGNRAGVVYTTPSAHLTAQNRFYQLSYSHALRWLHRHGFPSPGEGDLSGVIQHFINDRQRDKLHAALTSGAWPESLLRRAGGEAVAFPGGGYLAPAAWCAALLDHPAIEWRADRVVTVHAGAPATAELASGARLTADAIVLATAGATRALPGLDWLPLKAIRGQVSYCRATAASKQWSQAHCHGGYLTPALAGLHCVGATFDLHHLDTAPRDQDDAANLAQLKQYLPRHWQELGGDAIDVVERRVALRCQSVDFLPMAGALPDTGADPLALLPGLWLNIAHGSRGITGTPLCADLLADSISGAPLPVDPALAAALAPQRFIQRWRRKQPSQ
jgi:tRNA 5-methylaminomethyl-2-thiouridine biosynthesis bifunctional protein